MDARSIAPLLAKIASRTGRIATPRDYLTGRRHPPFPLPDNILLFVRRSYRELLDGTFVPHFHHRRVLVVPLQGSGTVLLEGRAHSLKPGSVLYVPPLRLHTYKNVSPEAILWLFVTFELPAIDPKLDSVRRALLNAQQVHVLEKLVNHWTQQVRDSTESALRLALELGVFLHWLESAATQMPQATGTGDTVILQKIQHWIEGSNRAEFSIEHLARKIGLSESRLRTRFRSAFGLSLGRYLRESRCRRAAQLLRTGQVSIGEVADALGYSSPFSFSRAFKMVVGVSPSEIQANARQPGRGAQLSNSPRRKRASNL